MKLSRNQGFSLYCVLFQIRTSDRQLTFSEGVQQWQTALFALYRFLLKAQSTFWKKKTKNKCTHKKKEGAFLDFLQPAEYCNQNLCVTGAMDRLQQTLSLTIMGLEELLYGLQVVTI